MSKYKREDFNKEVEWFESKIKGLLNIYAKITKICAYLKQWWNENVVKTRSKRARNKKKFR